MKFSFVKYQGAGNDFIVIDDRSRTFPLAESLYIARLCDRHFGIGADGLLLLQPSDHADFRMRIFNADGKEANQCGNGGRCLVDFIHQRVAPFTSVMIETAKGIMKGFLENRSIGINLGPYRWLKKGLEIGQWQIDLIETGVPHAVVFVEDLQVPLFEEVARSLRWDGALGPEGANINFACIKDVNVHTRTYERGVEGETLACGTGAAAVAVAAMERYSLPHRLCILPASQEELWVEVESSNVWLIGQAGWIFEGVVSYPIDSSLAYRKKVFVS